MKIKNTGCNFSSFVVGMTVSFFAMTSNASAAARLDHSLFQGLSFMEESVKRFSMEGKIKDTLGSSALSDGRIEILGNTVDEVSTTTKAQYYYKDLEVIGAMALTHQLVNQSSFSAVSEHTITPMSFDVTPRLSARQAFLIAKPLVGENPMRMAPTLKILPNMDRTDASLVYVIDFASKTMSPGVDIYIDANTGRVLANISHREEIAPISIYNAAKGKKVFIREMFPQTVRGAPAPSPTATPKAIGCQMLDPDTNQQSGGFGFDCDKVISAAEANGSVCEFLDGNKLDGVSPLMDIFPVASLPKGCNAQVVKSVWQTAVRDPSADRALQYSTKVAQYYLTVHGRDSFDGKGSELISFVNAGYKMDNAFWDSEQEEMTYGAGDGVTFDNFSKVLDVAGHEMTHGVVSKTAALLMMDENGALNEAIADFFGKMIENTNSWKMGQGLFLKDPTKPLRDLADPHSVLTTKLDRFGNPVQTPMPNHLREKFTLPAGATCDKTNDRCFVHDNSTIPSHAMFLMAQSIGKDKAQKIVYQTLTKRMTPRSNFRDTAAGMRASCKDLFDLFTCQQVDRSWTAVGL